MDLVATFDLVLQLYKSTKHQIFIILGFHMFKEHMYYSITTLYVDAEESLTLKEKGCGILYGLKKLWFSIECPSFVHRNMSFSKHWCQFLGIRDYICFLCLPQHLVECLTYNHCSIKFVDDCDCTD